MGWSKRQFCEAAYEEVGLAGYVFNLQPEQLQIAVKRLDSMMASWNARGIRLGYPIPENPKFTDLTADTNVPDYANEAVYKNLALKIAPVHGKQIAGDLRVDAKVAYNAMLTKSVGVREMAIGRLPAGAGAKCPTSPFIERAIDDLQSGLDGYIEYAGNENASGEDFS